MYREQSDLFIELQLMENEAENIQTLILGNSHAAKGINPQFLSQKGFNLAFSDQDLYYDYHLFKKFLPRLKQLKNLVLSLSYFSFGYNENKFNKHLTRDYLLRAKIKPRDGLSLNILLRCSLLYLHRQTFLTDIIKKKRKKPHLYIDLNQLPDKRPSRQVLFSNGYRYSANYMSPKALVKNVQKRIKLHTEVTYRSKYVPENIKIIKNLVDLALKNNIRVFVVTPPYSNPYANAFSDDFKNQFYKNVNEVISDYQDSLVKYKDFSQSKYFSHKLFYNPDHLNYRGSQTFTELLNSWIIKSE